jgi:alginate O-acetyltransferase complex protein AlgJ
MPLLQTHRRYLGAIILALLVLVMFGSLVPDPLGPPRPFTWDRGKTAFIDRANALSRAISNYVSGNFGYSRSMPYLRGFIGNEFNSPNHPNVYYGRNKRLYFNGDNAVGQSSGSVYRQAAVEHFAEVADAMRRTLAASGGELVVMVPPNSQSMPSKDLPAWWRISGPLEYDLAIRELHRRGVTTIDLKAAFAAMPDVDNLYLRTDSHWRRRASLLAYNMAMQAIGHAEWSLDPATTVGPLAPAPAGDLARLLAMSDLFSDSDYALNLPELASGWKPIDAFRSPPFQGKFVPYALERAPDGVGIIVLGDSFTLDFWRPLLLRSGAARIGWMHFALCSFDFSDLERFRPNYVIVAPTERFMPCPPTNWPKGLSRDETWASK